MEKVLTWRALGITLLLTLFAGNGIATTTNCDQIIGTWMGCDKNIVVQVYKDGDSFKASIVWFDDSDDKSQPMDVRLDRKNPDKSLRTRKVLGMQVLKNLEYNAESNSWENGIIYDAKNGHEWTSCASIDKDGTLKVTGYWHFKFIGKSIKFNRLSSSDRLLTAAR
jgi:uncharacterized protein (DUF2147 family)